MKELDLELIKNESKQILEGLPIAHYLKVDTIPIVFDETAETSYFNPKKFEIHIALSNIVKSLSNRKCEEISDLELEKTIRCFLYHEISHAILTPKDLMVFIPKFNEWAKSDLLTPSIVNILEDERIETILKGYYLLVDFRENLRNLCGKGAEPKSFEQFVFNAIRLKSSPIKQDFINLRLKIFVKTTKGICAGSTFAAWQLLDYMLQLTKFLKEIWDEIVAEREKEESSGSSTSEDEQESEDGAEGGSESSSKEVEESESEDSSSKEEKVDKATSEATNAETDSSMEEDDDDILTEEEKAKAIERTLENLKRLADSSGGRSMTLNDFASDEKTKLELLKAIIRNAGVGVQKQQALYSYSGRFNAKRFMKDYMTGNDTYKWFEKKAFNNSETTTRKSGKKILNIWLDQSGSFERNDEPVNKVLKALAEIEKTRSDFEWRLIKLTCTVEIVKDKEKRYSRSHTGNALPVSKYAKAYKETNASGNEFNVVLFDGPANSCDFDYEGVESKNETETYSFDALKPFNNKRAVFITETHNYSGIKRVCPEAKEVILENNDYPSVLAANVIKALDLLF